MSRFPIKTKPKCDIRITNRLPSRDIPIFFQDSTDSYFGKITPNTTLKSFINDYNVIDLTVWRVDPKVPIEDLFPPKELRDFAKSGIYPDNSLCELLATRNDVNLRIQAGLTFDVFENKGKIVFKRNHYTAEFDPNLTLDEIYLDNISDDRDFIVDKIYLSQSINLYDRLYEIIASRESLWM